MMIRKIPSAAAGLTLALLFVGAGCGPSATRPEARIAERPADDLLAEYLAKGEEYRAAGLPAKAAEQFESALALDDANVDVYPRLGRALVEAGNAERAAKICERWIQLAPKDCAARTGLGEAQLAQRLTDQAMKTFEDALRLCPEDASVWSRLGFAYEKTGYPIEAIEALRRSLEIEPDGVAARETLARIQFDRRQYPQAAAQYEALLAREDHGKDAAWVAWAHGRLAGLYEWGGDSERAIPHWESVVASTAAGPEAIGTALEGVVRCESAAGRVSKAIDACTRLVAVSPERPDAYYRLGDLLNRAGRYAEALEAARKGIEADGGCAAHGYCVLGVAYEKLGGLANVKRAEREFQKAVNCGEGPFLDLAVEQVKRQQALARDEEAKQGGAAAGTP
jgi:tetratricopeptide (TPR) repeat protein